VVPWVTVVEETLPVGSLRRQPTADLGRDAPAGVPEASPRGRRLAARAAECKYRRMDADATSGATTRTVSGRSDTDTRVGTKTLGGIPVDAVYGEANLGAPGDYPFTRGAYGTMYRDKLWTMRMFAGFGLVADTNRRFHELLGAGVTGLSTAFDMPTLMGRDSDHPWAVGEVGRAGVAVDSVADMDDLFGGINLGGVTTSMTINGPAVTLMAMYVAVADRRGTPRAALGGTIQNDILKEYQAQKEYIFPPAPSVRLVTDLMRFTSAELPRWHPVSVSGYHIREAGSTAAQELGFTLANGFAYIEAAVRAGLAVDDAARRMSFFFNAHSDFFEEIGKYRAARRIWARWLRERWGVTDERALRLRFHAQTSGVSLTAQQPEVNIARVALQALAAVLGGTQSLHTDAYDEALALPSEHAARLALRTQQVVAFETGAARVADPLGGSAYVEWMTDELERRAEAIFGHVDELGHGSMLDGVVAGIENGYFTGEIADAAYRYEREVAAGDRIIVGVNEFADAAGALPPLQTIDPRIETEQRVRLDAVRRQRSADTVGRALARVAEHASDPTRNVMPAIIEAVHAYATVGEVTAALEGVFGSYAEAAVA
jgi:methylmalonyl-CoA mutase N-terminal domain/subunit